jgi:DNA-binding response OmpR family regulator
MADEIPTILVADDDPDLLAMVVRHLKTMKCKVIEASDGEAALALAKKERPDLMIIDVMMPGKSGWEVCKAVREESSLGATGVIVLTGIGEQLNALTSPLYGADASIDKPFEFAELDFKIRKVLSDRRRKTKDDAGPPPEGKAKSKAKGKSKNA